MIPNVVIAIKRFEQPVTWFKIEHKKDNNFKYSDSITDIKHTRAVVQVADKEKLNAELIDLRQELYLVHTRSDFEINDYFKYHDKFFKVVTKGNWREYGYCEYVAEQIKGNFNV